jgi:hypothetical protein
VQRLMQLMAFWPLGRSRAGASPAPQHKVFPYPFARGFACDIIYVPIGTGFFYLVATPSTDAKRAPQSLPGSPSKIVGARIGGSATEPRQPCALPTCPRPQQQQAVVERDGSCYAYRHTQKGVQVALLFPFFHKCLCVPPTAASITGKTRA